MTEQGRFVVTLQDGVPVVDVSGDVDITNVGAFQAAVRSAFDSSHAGLVVSLRKIHYLDSRMVHELFTLARRVSQSRQTLAMVWPQSPSAHYIVETAGLPINVPFFGDVDEAVAAIKNAR